MPKTVLYIDGQNFYRRLRSALELQDIKSNDWSLPYTDFKYLFTEALKEFSVDEIRYYTADITEYVHDFELPPDEGRAIEARDRRLRYTAEKLGIKWLEVGNVLPGKGNQRCKYCKDSTVFNEKGVDMGLAVDLVIDAYDSERRVDVAIVCSADTDMLPAMKAAKQRGVKVVHLGFAAKPLKVYRMTNPEACSYVVKIRNDTIVEAFKRRKDIKPIPYRKRESNRKYWGSHKQIGD